MAALKSRVEALEAEIRPKDSKDQAKAWYREFGPRAADIHLRQREIAWGLEAPKTIRMKGRFMLRTPSYPRPLRRNLWPFHADKELAEDLGQLLDDLAERIVREQAQAREILEELAERADKVAAENPDNFTNFPHLKKPWRDVLFALWDESDEECEQLTGELLTSLPVGPRT